MQRKSVLRAIAGVAALHGVATLAGAVALADVTPFLRATASLSATPLLVAAWLLIRERRSAVVFLWLSAVVYVFSIVYPGLLRHGAEVFGVLMTTFYWSVGIRIALAVSAQLAFQFTTNASHAGADV